MVCTWAGEDNRAAVVPGGPHAALVADGAVDVCHGNQCRRSGGRFRRHLPDGIQLFRLELGRRGVRWVLAGFFILVPMHRMGMYTNAEYLEARFGVGTRITSVFVQLQFRTLVMGMMSISIFRILSVVCGWDWLAWAAVVLVAALAAAYTAVGGMRSVAITDTLQVVVMSAAALLIWFVIWGAVGGWDGLQQRLEAAQPSLEKQILHVGRDNVDREDVSALTPNQIQARLMAGGEYDPDSKVIVGRTPFWILTLSMI